MKKIWEWLAELVQQLFGGKPKAVKITGKKLCVPLFYPKTGGGTDGTWNYLSKSPTERQRCREYIKLYAAQGEVPAIAFLLSPNHEGGDLFSNANNPAAGVKPASAEQAVECMKELCREEIAVLAVCYTDDQSPRWNDAPAHASGWAQLWGYIEPYVSAVLLSIESTERGSHLAVQHCVAALKNAMPGAQAYGTHQQWGVKWSGPSDTPDNCDLILVETTNHPAQNPGMSKLMRETDAVVAAAGARRIVMHEYFFSPTDEMRSWLRSRGLWGVG